MDSDNFALKWSMRGLGKEDAWSQLPNREHNQRYEFEDCNEWQSVVFSDYEWFLSVRSGIEVKGRNTMNIKRIKDWLFNKKKYTIQLIHQTQNTTQRLYPWIYNLIAQQETEES